MSYFKKAKTLSFAPNDVFALVGDIAAYPDFIKWITAMRVSEQRVEDGNSVCLGDALVGFKGFVERFTTKVTADPVARTVTADLVRGPFRKLQAIWTVDASEGGGCTCTLAIDYEFSNPIIRLLASANQDMAAERIMAAFMAEADRRFGEQAAVSEADA